MGYCKIVTVLAGFIVAGCASHEGEYSPGCIAYAGSTITLDGGRFVWERFTDQVKVDEEGRVVDPFPGYPKRGTYTIDGQTVYLASNNGTTLDTFYLHERDGAHLLLTAEENASWQQTGRYSDCVLTLNSATAN